jgi:hypothetical protein
MPSKSIAVSQNILVKFLPILLSIAGGILLVYASFFWNRGSIPVVPGLYSENFSVPVDYFNFGTDLIPVEFDNFLLFRNYESLSPNTFPKLTLAYGVAVWSLVLMGLALVTTFRKMYFVGAAAGAIFLFTFSGINGLNIGSVASNYALLSLLLGVLIPMLYLHFFAVQLGLVTRMLIMLIAGWGTVWLLVSISEVVSPWLLLGENLSFPAALLASLFLFNIGHAVVSGSTILLIRLNKNIRLKISWHITILFLIYFLLVLFTLLEIMGEINLPFPTASPVLLMLIAGVLGYFVLKTKMEQVALQFPSPDIAICLYWIGFAVATLTWGKALITDNEPLAEYFNHIFLYSQVAISLIFFAYLLANFLDILNSGKAVDKVLFKPEIFAYWHMRIGSIMAMVILVIYADGIIGIQLASATTNQSADYYYQTERPLEAAILYENSWLQYRKNDKAKLAAAHLRYELRQPSAGLELLTESFDYSPNIPGILLLSNKLHQSGKIFEALFYLEKGLEYFPDNPFLLNNLALLYSGINRPQDAIEAIAKVEDPNPVLLSNRLALQLKHKLKVIPPSETLADLVYQINVLAWYNSNGNFAPFELDTEALPPDNLLAAAVLRNQWSNKVTTGLEKDLNLIDSLINSGLPAIEDQNYRETRILRTYQEGYINETLKYLNGTAATHQGSAGYFLELSSRILAAQLDYQKAAIDLELAIKAGFQNIRPHHLVLLHYGEKEATAASLHQKSGVSFPYWFEEAESNDHKRYFKIAARLNGQFGSNVLQEIQLMQNPDLKNSLMQSFLMQKIHWLDQTSLQEFLKDFDDIPNSPWNRAMLDEVVAFTATGNAGELSESTKQLINPERALNRNAYRTPLVLLAFNKEPDELQRYDILQDAIQFNRDPLLWMRYVNQSRKLGMDNYSSDALYSMQEWLTLEEIEKLLLENQ